MERKKVYFSNYVDEQNITTCPKRIEVSGRYRYSISIPLISTKPTDGGTVVVIMKNPSKAGRVDQNASRKLSDETLYRVIDYAYKHGFSNVIILNLLPIYGSIVDNIQFDNEDELVDDPLQPGKNMRVIRETIANLRTSDKVILAWGGYPDIPSESFDHQIYRDQINNVLDILNERPKFVVGDLVKRGFPQHGLQWYDFEEMRPVERKQRYSWLLEFQLME